MAVGAALQELVRLVRGQALLGHDHALGPLEDRRHRGPRLQVLDLGAQPGHHLGQGQRLRCCAPSRRQCLVLHTSRMPLPRVPGGRRRGPWFPDWPDSARGRGQRGRR
ncbi:hypothetical protein VR44_34890 [Streptomyces katrae]|uniref:Uncharacterized protein n=1 Tax=Streptomyces katrae TaxID=68223 RepID=A0A0F4ISH1_9ACTN|nr:hypothetical protein VR44_34890 [Streptomyces katrae]